MPEWWITIFRLLPIAMNFRICEDLWKKKRQIISAFLPVLARMWRNFVTAVTLWGGSTVQMCYMKKIMSVGGASGRIEGQCFAGSAGKQQLLGKV